MLNAAEPLLVRVTVCEEVAPNLTLVKFTWDGLMASDEAGNMTARARN